MSTIYGEGYVADCVQRLCCNEDCGWTGTTDRVLRGRFGDVGPLCPDCGEVTEPEGAYLYLAAGVQVLPPIETCAACYTARPDGCRGGAGCVRALGVPGTDKPVTEQPL